MKTKLTGISFRNLQIEIPVDTELVIKPDPLGKATGQVHTDTNALSLWYKKQFLPDGEVTFQAKQGHFIGYIPKDLNQNIFKSVTVTQVWYKENQEGQQPIGTEYIEGAYVAGIEVECKLNEQSVFHNIEQNTDAWFKLRAGRITSSSFAKIMAHGEKKFGKPAIEYAIQLSTEKRFGWQDKPRNFGKRAEEEMQRGHEQEADAIKAYEKKTGNKVTNGGIFIAGALADSPDGVVQDPTMTSKGLLEVKSVIVSTQDKTILRSDIDSCYKWQVMFHLWVTGYAWLDYVSYSPEHETPLFIKRVYRCDETIEEMRKYIIEFQKIVNLQSELIEDSIKLFRRR